MTAKTDPRDQVSGHELAVRCQRAIEGLDGLEDLLQPYIDLWSDRRAADNASRPRGSKLNFWNYDGPHSRVNYVIRWDRSDMGSLLFEGTDPDGDSHSWELPLTFLGEYETEAAAAAEAKKKAAEAEAARQRAAQEADRKRARDRQFAQYQELKKEFEPSGR